MSQPDGRTAAVPADEADADADAGRHVGKPVPRTDARDKVTGQALFTMDLDPGHLLHAKYVTSTVPHARLERVDTSAAESLAGVVAVATYADVPDTRRGQYILDQPILATEKVRYVGEPIAVVAAETEALAERAASLVEVEYEPLDPVFDLEAAFRREPPAAVHEDVRGYEFATQGDPRYESRGHVADEDADRPNLMYKDSAHVGDVDAALDAADHVIEGEYEVKAFQHCAMEPHVAIAHVRSRETVIWTSEQVPHNVVSELCMAYPDLDPAHLVVRTPYVGGGFGGKITPFHEARLLAVARLVSRPVRLALTRAEEFTTSVNRPQVITRVTDGVTDDGDLVARDVDILFNAGAYNEQVFRCTCSGPSATVGSYDIPNVRWNSHAVYTNLPLGGAFRGFGKPEVNWGMERHMNRVAEELGLDPVEYRSRNLLRTGDRNAKSETLGPNDTDGCLRTPVDRLAETDLEEHRIGHPKYAGDEWVFGRGIAYGNKPVSRAAAAVTVEIRRGMTVVVHAGAPDIGQGAETMLTQIAAEEFAVDRDRVRIVAGDTDKTPYDRGPTGSRFTYHTGNALRKAAAEVKRKLFEQAAVEFDDSVAAADLDVAGDHVFVRAEPDRRIHVDEVFSSYGQQVGVADRMLKQGGELVGTATYDSRRGGEDHAFWTPVGQAVDVAVNTLTGQAEVVRCVTAADVGRAINPKMVEQQLEGATAQGIASALYEEIVFDNGRVVNPNFKDYRVPGSTELPYDNETVVFESADEEGPYGARGVGEMGMIAAAPAVGNALVDALDIEFEVIPVSPQRVIDALDRQG